MTSIDAVVYRELMTATYCNPVNLPYRFQDPRRARECFREAADPSVVEFQGKYWLFPSKSGGYFHSDDLRSWSWVRTTTLPVDDYAPDVRVLGGWLYFTASRTDRPCPIFRTQDPAADIWEMVSQPFAFFDPDIFFDDDHKAYLYWGCSNSSPVYGVELDPGAMVPVRQQDGKLPGGARGLIHGSPAEHGWERTGNDNTEGDAPYIEGAWMTKHSGRYYLQYAAPGTQFNVYGDGVYVGDAPLGPFAYAPHNPFSFKPGGFIPGAGHGSTFADTHGNLWHASTMRISAKHMFERRIGLFPAGIDGDGILFCNTAFGDYPTCIADRRWDPWRDPFAGWMLLSYGGAGGSTGVRAAASSCASDHEPHHAVNEDVRSFWAASRRGGEEWLQVDLGSVAEVRAVQINFAECECECDAGSGGFDYRERGAHRYRLELSGDGRRWRVAADRKESVDDAPHDYVELAEPVEARYVRVSISSMPANGIAAISGLRVFGFGRGAQPDPIAAATVVAARSSADPCVASLAWPARDWGHNVWWGIAPDKLYSTWMVYGRSDLTLRCLNAGVEYWMRVDAFNACGVAAGEPFRLRVASGAGPAGS